MAGLVVTLLVAYGLLCAGAYVFQSRLLYLPSGPPRTTPAEVGLEFEAVELVAADGTRLSAWWIPAREPWAGALVAHGNAGNISNRLHIARAWKAMGVSTLLFDYRGYGASDGSPSEAGLYADATAAYGELVRRLGLAGLGPERAIAHGESLGGAVVVELALREPLGAVVIESAWSSLPELASRLYPFLPVRLLLRERFDTLERVAKLDVPLLVLHGRGDEIVPFEHGVDIARAGSAELLELSGGHNSGGFGTQPEVAARVEAFVREALGVQ